MSGTAFGTAVLHVSPESSVGGPLALVRDGDSILLDVSARLLQLNVSPEELRKRKASWTPPEVPEQYRRGYAKMYLDHVLQADEGCDLDFLRGRSGSFVPRGSH